MQLLMYSIVSAEQPNPNYSAPFAAPEIIRQHGRAEPPASGAPQDIWSLGALVFQLFTACDADMELPFGPLSKDYQALQAAPAESVKAATHASVQAEHVKWVCNRSSFLVA